MPFRFPDHNPFQKAVRLRNWLIYMLLRDFGLRRSEALKIKLEDLPRGADGVILLRRRPDDPADPRKAGPSVKGMEGSIPVTPVLTAGLRIYVTGRRSPGHRRGPGGGYLLTSLLGRPLSAGALDGIWKTVKRRHPAEFPVLTSHVLRHTWAEDLADQLLLDSHYDQEVALAILRELGRWKPGSDTPMLYIQNTLRKEGNRILRSRHPQLAGGLA